MRLLVSQQDSLYELIEAAGLSPAQFSFIEVDSQLIPGEKATELRCNNSDFFFRFETGVRGIDTHYAIFCPGEQSFLKKEYPGAWSYQLSYVREWLTFLVREISSPNKWERLQKEIEGIRTSSDNDEDKFSAQEYEELRAKMLALKQGVSQIDMFADQIEVINTKLDHLTEMARELNKFDWKSLFLGTIGSIIIQLGVTPDNAKALWGLMRQIFNNYILP